MLKKKMALIDDKNKCLGLLVSKDLKHFDKLNIRQFNRATGEEILLQCHVSEAEKDVMPIQSLHDNMTNPTFKSLFKYDLLNNENSLLPLNAFYQNNKAGNEISELINTLSTSNNVISQWAAKSLIVLNYIDEFIPLYDKENELKMLELMPKNAFIYDKNHGIIKINKVIKKTKETIKLDVDKYQLKDKSDQGEFVSKNKETIELKNESYLYLGVEEIEDIKKQVAYN